MMKLSVLSIDIGTTYIKAGVISKNGELLWFRRFSSRFKTEDWHEILREIGENLEREGIEPAAVGVCGNGPTLIPVGTSGEPIGDPISWMDGRDQQYLPEMEELLNQVNSDLVPRYYLGKIFAMMQEDRSAYNKTTAFLPCPEYLNFYLTGNKHAILYTPQAFRYLWDQKGVETLGFDLQKFPPFIPTGELCGYISSLGSKRSGLKEGIPVVACGTDFLMSVLGTGTFFPGEVCDRIGTSEGFNYCSADEVLDQKLLTMPHIIEGNYNVSGILPTSGKAVSWIKDTTGGEDVSYEEYYKEVESVTPGSGGILFLPALHGGHPAKGCFSGVSLKSGRTDLWRAVVEGTGFAIREVMERLGDNRLEIKKIKITGRAASNPTWCQTRADILGVPLSVLKIKDSELTGAAAVSLYYLRAFDSLLSAGKQIVREEKVYVPAEKNRQIYNSIFEKYKRFSRILLDLE